MAAVLTMEGRLNILEKLSDLKESHLIETAEYAISQNLQGEPMFNWRVLYFIKKRERIISVVKR